MKVFLCSSFLLHLIQSDQREKLKHLLLDSIDSNTRFFTSAYSIHVLFQELGEVNIEKKSLILRNLEDLTDTIFSLGLEEIRSELLLEQNLGLEQTIALSQGIDVFYCLHEEGNPTHPLLKVRNFFGETK